METPSGEKRGLGAAARIVSERASSIMRLELQLAAAELKKKVASLGVGIGLLVVAAFVGVFALGFGFAAVAAALATFLATWLALLIVTGGLFLFAGLLVVLGRRMLRKGTPLVPEQAIEEAKLTSEALRNGNN
jgi:membrane protein implicated in regulation of membrane protease activity